MFCARTTSSHFYSKTCFSSIIINKTKTLWCRNIMIDDVLWLISHKNESNDEGLGLQGRTTASFLSLYLTLGAVNGPFLISAPVGMSGSPAGSFWHSCRFSSAAYLCMGTYLGFPAPFTPSGVPKAEEDERPQLSKIWRRVHPQFWQQTPICAIFAPTSQFFQVLKVLDLVFLKLNARWRFSNSQKEAKEGTELKVKRCCYSSLKKGLF